MKRYLHLIGLDGKQWAGEVETGDMAPAHVLFRGVVYHHLFERIGEHCVEHRYEQRFERPLSVHDNALDAAQ